MSIVLSVYSKKAFKEYLLPAIDNSNYSIVINSELFGLNKDVELPMEILDGKWKFISDETAKIWHSGTQAKYNGEVLKEEDNLSLVLNGEDKISILVKEIQNVFAVFQKYHFFDQNEITVGNMDNNAIVFDNMGLVSRIHVLLHRKGEVCTVEDKSSNGCFINGRRVKQTAELSYGDCLDIFGLRIIYLGGFIAIHASSGYLQIKESALKPYEVKKCEVPMKAEEYKKEEKKLFHRSPRYLPKVAEDRVEIEAPPAPKENTTPPTFMAIGPSLTMALPMMAGSLLSVYASRAGGGSGLFMFTGLITAVGSAAIGATWAIVNIRRAKKKNREEEMKRFQAYSEYLIHKANEVKSRYETGTIHLRELYPNTQKCSEYDKSSLELWNRNWRHLDFLSERLGIGAMKFPVEIDIPKERFNMINDSLAEKPKMIKESYKYLRDVPICLDLFEHKMVGVIGGAGKHGCFNVMYNLVTQIAANNCYTDVKMIFIYDENRGLGSPLWQFAKWLPHVWAEDKKTRFVAGSKADANEVFYDLTRTLRFRAESMGKDASGKRVIAKPYYVLFLENPELIEGELIAKYIYDTTSDYGLSTVVLVESYEDLPNACEYIVENTESFKGAYHVADAIEERTLIQFDPINRKQLENFTRRLASIEVKEEETSGEIPNALTFFEMYGVSRPEELGVLDRWKKSRTSETMKALVGQKAGGGDCYLDVHEKYHGPHGLVAGTTGSGKSETLQTYMLSLALNYSPDDIGFFIIDYKGGGMANLFEGLPHMIGQISNLSGNQVKRAMVSIKSENLRRQRVFNEHGVNNINLYTRLYKNNEAKMPIPHMFIIIDEFAELKREEPDFMRELISVAQVGRSLGVHLILATQKPSGTVDDNIWSNSKFRLCLRVQDKQDSMDMLHKPDAAYITQAGRSYLQVGNDELYELFQSGWSGATYDENAGSVQTNIAQMLSLNGKAALIGSHAKIKQKEKSKAAWIGKLLSLVDTALKEQGIVLSSCKDNSSLLSTLTKKVFEVIERTGVEYPESDYNVHRIKDLITEYIALQEKAYEGERAEVLIKNATDNGVKLPEMKEKTQLDAVIAHLADVARENGYVHNLKLWLPVLPETLYLHELSGYEANSFDGEKWPEAPKNYSLETMVGLYDAPANQAQEPISVDIAQDGNHAIIGTVVSGKSTFLMTYVYSLINRYTPDAVNLYLLDYSSKMLGALEDAPHVGGVMFEEDEDKVSKFFNMLKKMLEERKKLFKGGSYSQYIQVHGTVVPAIVVVIDNMASFRTKTEEKYDELLHVILKEGLNYGIYVIASAAGFGMSEIPNRMGENFRSIICLEMNDKFAYSDALRIMHLEVLPEENVKGRGITKIGDSVLEFQTALTISAEDDYKRGEAIRERCELLRDFWKGSLARRVPEIPERPTWDKFIELPEVKEMAAEERLLPIGYDRESAAAYGISLPHTYCYMVSGRPRTGKSNFLKVLIHSASLLDSEVAVIDFSGELEVVAEKTGATYLHTVQGMKEYFEGIISTFKERNELKKSLSARGLSGLEIFEEMKKFRKIFFIIQDMHRFVDFLVNPGEDIPPMANFVNNLFDKGSVHNVFWFAQVNQEERTGMLYEAAFQTYIRYGTGIYFGGKVEEQQLLNYEHMDYVEKGKKEKTGIGLLPTHEEDETNAVVVPLYKMEM